MDLMVNILNSFCVRALVAEILHMRMYRSKFLRHLAFRSVWQHKLVEVFSSKIQKVKLKKSELKYLRDLSLQGQETSKTSLLATYFLSDFHLPGKKCLYILLNISDLFHKTQFRKRNTKSYQLSHILFYFIFIFYLFYVKVSLITGTLSKFVSIILDVSFLKLNYAERAMMNYRDQIIKLVHN